VRELIRAEVGTKERLPGCGEVVVGLGRSGGGGWRGLLRYFPGVAWVFKTPLWIRYWTL